MSDPESPAPPPAPVAPEPAVGASGGRRWGPSLIALALALVLLVVILVVRGHRGNPAPNPAADCSSAAHLAGWTCTFDDEFDGATLDTSKWVAASNFVIGAATQRFACYKPWPRDVSVSGGSLHLSVRRELRPITCPGGQTSYYSAGTISTFGRFSQQYGRFEARIKVSATREPGLYENFWLWPDRRYSRVDWPTSGEMDLAQLFSSEPDSVVPYLHYTADDNGGPIRGTNTAACPAHRGVWNTYRLTWSPSSFAISVNGRTCLVNHSDDPAFRKRYIMILTEGLGPSMSADRLTATTELPSTMDVDYVRVWRRD